MKSLLEAVKDWVPDWLPEAAMNVLALLVIGFVAGIGFTIGGLTVLGVAG